MKARFIVLVFVFALSVGFVASACNIDVALVNQDPYPAMPGDYVKIVFQVSGLAAQECQNVEFWLDQPFPFSLDPTTKNNITLKSGTYVRDYQDYFLVPYKIRVDENALEGDNKLPVHYSVLSGAAKTDFLKDFTINVEDSRTDFEVYVSNYDSSTKEITFDLLNIGESDVEGLTIELPKQDGVKIIGANQVIVGDLNSNEDDSATFKVDAGEQDLVLKVLYTDQINVRRFLEKTVHFDPSIFKNLEEEKSSFSSTLAFIIGLLIPILFFYIRGRLRRRKERAMKKKGMVKF